MTWRSRYDMQISIDSIDGLYYILHVSRTGESDRDDWRCRPSDRIRGGCPAHRRLRRNAAGHGGRDPRRRRGRRARGRCTHQARAGSRDQRAQDRGQPPQRARQHRADNRRRQGARGAECAPPRLEPAGALRSCSGRRDRCPGARDRRRRCRGGAARARIPDRRRSDRCRAGAARAPGYLSARAARARCDRPACGHRPLRGACVVGAQARDVRLRRCAYRSVPGHAGRHFGGTKPTGESAQQPGQRRLRRRRCVLQAFRQLDLPMGWPGGCTDPVDDSGIAPSHATSPCAICRNEANRKSHARHPMFAEAAE